VTPPTLKGVSEAEARRLIDEFDNTYISLTNPVVVRNSDSLEINDIHTGIRDEGDGSWTPIITFEDGTVVTLDDFNKNY
jgi:hypothetical protein